MDQLQSHVYLSKLTGPPCPAFSRRSLGGENLMDLLDRLLEHDAWTTRQLLLLCENLTDKQLDHEFDIGHRTVRSTFEHIIRNVEVWSDLMSCERSNSTTNNQGSSISDLIGRLDISAVKFAQLAKAVAERSGWDEHWLDTLDNPPREKNVRGSDCACTHPQHASSPAIAISASHAGSKATTRGRCV